MMMSIGTDDGNRNRITQKNSRLEAPYNEERGQHLSPIQRQRLIMHQVQQPVPSDRPILRGGPLQRADGHCVAGEGRQRCVGQAGCVTPRRQVAREGAEGRGGGGGGEGLGGDLWEEGVVGVRGKRGGVRCARQNKIRQA